MSKEVKVNKVQINLAYSDWDDVCWTQCAKVLGFKVVGMFGLL